MLTLARIAPVLVPVVAAMGCGGDAVAGPDATVLETAIAITVEPAELVLDRAEEARVTIRIEREPSLEGPVTLAPVGVPDGVEIVVDEPSTAGSETGATVRVTDAEPGLYALWIHGESAGGSSSAGFALEVPDTSISGTVVDLRGAPVPAVTVSVGDDVQVADAAGRFHFDAAPSVYDAVVVRDGATGPEVHRYVGLTRRDPTLQLINLLPPQPHGAVLRGTLTGGAGYPHAGDVVAFVAFAAADAGASVVLGPGAGPDFELDVSWRGETELTGEVHALQWRMDGAGLPGEFLGHAVTEVALTSGGEVSMGTLALEGVDTAHLSVQLSQPPAYEPHRNTVYLRLGPRIAIPLAIESTPGLDASYRVPALPLPLAVASTVRSGDLRSSTYVANVAPEDIVEAMIPEAPVLATPEGGATGVTPDTELRWSPLSGGVHVVLLVPASGAGFAIYTQGVNATIPDLPHLDLPFPRGADYTWGVTGIGPYDDLDDYASPDGGLHTFGSPWDTLLGLTGARTLTTAP